MTPDRRDNLSAASRRVAPRATPVMESLESKRFFAATVATPALRAPAPIVAVSRAATPAATTLATRTRGDITPTPVPSAGSGSVLDPGWVLTPVTTGAPQIVMLAKQGDSIRAGHAYHVQATGTIIPGAQAEDASFEWDFGDVGSRFNRLPGFNVAHVYEQPGTYTVTLTVTAPNGLVSTQQRTVTVTAAMSQTLYVAADGNDASAGTSSDAPLRTLARAVAIAGEGSNILLRRGDTFLQSSQVEIRRSGITIGSYGSGTATPTLMWNGPRQRNIMLWANPETSNVTIRGLTFDSIYNGDTEQSGMPTAIQAGGSSLTVRDNVFLNIGYCVNANSNPRGLLVQDNKAPSPVGVRDYLVWCQGSDLVIIGNEVANSTREHNVRVSGVDRITVALNKLTNLDRTANGDRSDNAKGTIACQKGSFAYIANNQLRGPAGVGPLGGPDGAGDRQARFSNARVQDNVQLEGTFFLQHGANHVTLTRNTIFRDDTQAIEIVGWDNTYGRGDSDIVIDHNVAVNNGPLGRGNFLLVSSAAEGITLTDNVYVAPYLAPGGWGTAAVWVNAADLSMFRRIDGNTWPSGIRANSYAQGGVNFVDTTYSSAGHKDMSEWNLLAQVGDDRFEDVLLDDAITRAFGTVA